MTGLAPGYLADDCQLVTDARARLLRYADTRTLTVHRTSSCLGDRTFAAAATRVWNSLPADLRNAELSYSGLRRSLKTFFILTVRLRRIVNCSFLTAPCRNIRTYLLTYLTAEWSLLALFTYKSFLMANYFYSSVCCRNVTATAGAVL